MKKGDKVVFGASKTLSFIRPLGAGGTGTTMLFHDDMADLYFAIKRYDPKGGNDPEECFRRFIEEAKISLRLSHQNIVRTYDYFLYPNERTGYLMMEYIDGVPIDEYDPSGLGDTWDKVFVEAISAFEAIEAAGMLHRDIRPDNLLIDNRGNLKVIDFGFGKQLTKTADNEMSVYLNWPATAPFEVRQGHYTHSTDIYYLGMLFASLDKMRTSGTFSHESVLNSMIEPNPANRFQSFAEIRKAMLSNNTIVFTDEQKALYLTIASVVDDSLAKIKGGNTRMRDPQDALSRIKILTERTSLEEYLQDVSLLIGCFILNDFSYYPHAACCPVSDLCEFYHFFSSISEEGREVVLNNLLIRIRKNEMNIIEEDIPF